MNAYEYVNKRKGLAPLGEGIIVNFEDAVNQTGDYACVNCPGWKGTTVVEVVDHINTAGHLLYGGTPEKVG